MYQHQETPQTPAARLTASEEYCIVRFTPQHKEVISFGIITLPVKTRTPGLPSEQNISPEARHMKASVAQSTAGVFAVQSEGTN
eukprot:jgi/Chlat1/4303/Chrsp29S04599